MDKKPKILSCDSSAASNKPPFTCHFRKAAVVFLVTMKTAIVLTAKLNESDRQLNFLCRIFRELSSLVWKADNLLYTHALCVDCTETENKDKRKVDEPATGTMKWPFQFSRLYTNVQRGSETCGRSSWLILADILSENVLVLSENPTCSTRPWNKLSMQISCVSETADLIKENRETRNFSMSVEWEHNMSVWRIMVAVAQISTNLSFGSWPSRTLGGKDQKSCYTWNVENANLQKPFTCELLFFPHLMSFCVRNEGRRCTKELLNRITWNLKPKSILCCEI